MSRFFNFYILLFLVFLSVKADSAVAKEVIHSYDTKIVVEEDGGLNIIETIEVTAEGQNIKRGIYREFPLARRTFLGGILPFKPLIIYVKKDGKPEPYHMERNDMSQRLYIGSSNVYLSTGRRYTYEIMYKIPDQVFFYGDYDELNWNVIGTGWIFPIERASAHIVLPGSAPILNHSVYTGKALSRDTERASISSGPGYFIATLTGSLAPHEGMTAAVSWPKGYVEPAANIAGLGFFWHQHPGLYLGLLCLLLTAAYYYWIWWLAGRDPKGRSLTPFYDPPKDISPAMAAYIKTMGSADNAKLLTSALMSLAAKGYITIVEEGPDHYRLTRTAQAESDRPAISEDEKVLFDEIGSSLIIQPDSENLIEASSLHRKTLATLCHKHYFYTNRLIWAGGFLPLVFTLIALSAQQIVPPEALWLGVLFMTVFGGVSLTVIWTAIGKLFKGPVSGKIQAIFLLIWAIAFSGGGFMGLFFMGSAISWLLIAVLIITIICILIMAPLMKAPTRKGRDLMDQIDGLRYYMEAVEEKILKKFNPPQMSRELYEKYLPYAVALDVESKWADKFLLATAGTLAGAAAASHISPSWYHSAHGGSFSSGGFSAGSMVSSFGSALSAASTSSSSGSGGGGSVGGGGGGGGGGGW